MIKQENKLWLDVDVDGKKYANVMSYKLYFNTEGVLIDVKNQNGYSVEKQSVCWEYFDNKYNK